MREWVGEIENDREREREREREPERERERESHHLQQTSTEIQLIAMQMRTVYLWLTASGWPPWQRNTTAQLWQFLRCRKEHGPNCPHCEWCIWDDKSLRRLASRFVSPSAWRLLFVGLYKMDHWVNYVLVWVSVLHWCWSNTKTFELSNCQDQVKV